MVDLGDPRHRLARDRWLAGDPVEMIARAVRSATTTIYYWSYRFNWPHRVPVQRRRSIYRWQRADWDAARAQRRDMAAQLWQADVPEVDIVNLCEVGRTTLHRWRDLFRWPRKRDGRKPLTRWGLQKARTARDLLARDRMARLRALRGLGVIGPHEPRRPKALPRWRCCERLIEENDCPTCGRRHPLACA